MTASARALLCGAFFALAAGPLLAQPVPATIEFRGEVQAEWELVPKQRSITVTRGEIFEAEVRIRNKSGREVLAGVLTEASPDGALVHLGCGPDFSLILQPGEEAVIPATYYVPEGAVVQPGALHLRYSVYSFEALSPDPRQVGRQIYASRCVSCHGSRGLGDGPIARFLAGGVGDLTPALRSKGDGMLLDVIASGVGPMPSFAAALTDLERRALLLHLRDLVGVAP
jgi:mono/diheme cytochrome c family protein